MEFDFAQLEPQQRYKLLAASITPRPIAWITTQSESGEPNAAPYSFFNVVAADPPLVVIGMMRRPDGTFKDTAANILDTGEFVLHLVTDADAAAMNFTCIDAPPGFDELAAAGIATLPSSVIAPPRIASAPVALECRLYQSIDTGASTIVLGEVLRFHIVDEFVDAEKLYVDTVKMELVARMHGNGWYTRSTDLFEMPRPVFDEWLDGETTAPRS